MRILKRIFFGILAIIAILLIAALFVKKEFAVTRDIVIAKPKNAVYDYIKFLKNQNEYSKWAKMDPQMKKTFTGADGTVGFISAWDGQADSVGKGEQEIKKIVDGERIDYELRFKTPMESVAQAHMGLVAIDSSNTKVEWGFSGSTPYPFNLLTACMNMDKQIGNDLQVGLNNLKSIMEQ